jgi:general nucleoside transport system permease protein
MNSFVEFLFATRTIWAVLIALLLGSAMILAAGANPIAAYSSLFGDAFFDYYGFGSTLVKMSPILLAGLAVAVPMQAGLFNVGGEGQIYIGALFTSVVALYAPQMDGTLHLMLAAIAGVVGGALWALIPAYLKAYRGVNEVITTLLLNYVGVDIVSYAAGGPMMEPGAPYPYSAEISPDLWLPQILPGAGAHIGVLVGLILAVLLYGILRLTAFGFAMTTVGRNAAAARYAGISVRRQMILSMMLGGALAGLAGSLEVLGVKYRLFHMFSNGYGFDGIVVAFMADANPILIPIAALFLSGLKAGAQLMQRAAGVESTVVDAIQGLVVIFVAAGLALRFQDSSWARLLARRRAAEAILVARNMTDA